MPWDTQIVVESIVKLKEMSVDAVSAAMNENTSTMLSRR